MQLRELRRAGHTPSLVAALLHFDVSFMVWVIIGALGAYIAKDLGLSDAQKGLMVAVPPLGGSCFRLVMGPLVDRFGPRRTGILSLGLTFLPLLWGWLAAGTYEQVLGIGLMLGIAGSSFVIALPLASRWYPPEHQGLAMGIAGAGNSGTLIASLAAPRVAEHVGWHGTFGFAMVPCALVWVAFVVLAKEPPAQPAAAGAAKTPLALLKEADARWLCLFYMVSFGGFVGLSGYLPIFFVDRFGLTKVTAAGYAALCASAGSFLRPIGGRFADRFGGTHVLVVVLGLVGACAVALSLLPALALTVVVLFATLGALGVGNGAVFQLVGQRFQGRMGSVTGLVGAAGGVGGFLLPFGLGSLKGATGTAASGFVLFAVVAALAALTVEVRRRAWKAPSVEVVFS